jgi:hypothetical protein
VIKSVGGKEWARLTTARFHLVGDRVRERRPARGFGLEAGCEGGRIKALVSIAFCNPIQVVKYAQPPHGQIGWVERQCGLDTPKAKQSENVMSGEPKSLAQTVNAMRPMVPAKDFEISKQFYIELGFQPRPLTDRLIEMQLGVFSFVLQAYYVREWADNFVVHVTVSDIDLWWDHIVGLDLPARYGVKTQAPQPEGWAVVAGVTDPSGVLWRFAETSSQTP